MSSLPADVRRAFAAAIDVARLACASGHGADELAEHLYAGWYGAPVAPVDGPCDLPDDLAALLRAAHAASERWEDGWVVERAGPDGRIVVARNGEHRLLDCVDYVNPGHPGIVPTAGAGVLAPARRDHVDPGEGWWYTHHESWRLDAPEGELVRVYWNIGPVAVALLVRRLSSLLSDRGVPWMLKCAIAREPYSRPDAAVLFLPREGIDRLRGALDGVAAALSHELRAGTPPLTLRVHQGVAVSDDPGTGESFGQHRCRLIAEGIRAAAGRDLLPSIIERFREAGVPPDRPYAAAAAPKLPWE